MALDAHMVSRTAVGMGGSSVSHLDESTTMGLVSSSSALGLS
jgi:hypothetical protein